MEKTIRAFELDSLRGFALFMMILHHMIFDFRYLLGLKVFAFQESLWFNHILQPAFLIIFLVVSGICCQFSRNNIRRSLKLFIISAVFSLGMFAGSVIFKQELYVFFNVLHLLAVGTLLYGLFSLWEEKMTKRQKKSDFPSFDTSKYGDIILVLLSCAIIYGDQLTSVYAGRVQSYWLLPLGFLPDNYIGMGDYLPILPWLGFFFAGAVIGRIAYKQKTTIFPRTPDSVLTFTRPFAWFGRNSLLIYLVHQPILLAILYGLRYLGVW